MPRGWAATSSRCWCRNCDAAQAERLAGAVLAAVRDADLGPAATSRKLAASIGIAFVDDANTTVADALACADDACYAAKAAGRNRFAVFSAETASGSGGLNAARVAADTVDAMEDGRLKLFGQEIHLLGKPWAREPPCRSAGAARRAQRPADPAGRVHSGGRALRHCLQARPLDHQDRAVAAWRGACDRAR